MVIENKEIIAKLLKKAAENRHLLVDLVHAAGYAHIGGSLSSCDIITALYYHFINFSLENQNHPNRDRFVLSKGHAGNMLYCILADIGFYNKAELRKEFKKYLGRWGEHPNRTLNPGIEISSGSLGHGLPIALGMALAGYLDGSTRRIFCLIGDGELQEGSNWESIMSAGHHKYRNLILLVDHNKVQGTRFVNEILNSGSIAHRIANFGWDVREVDDGNDMFQLFSALSNLPEAKSERGKPICLLLNTIKGCGVDFFENDSANCHAVTIKDEMRENAHISIDRKLLIELSKYDMNKRLIAKGKQYDQNMETW